VADTSQNIGGDFQHQDAKGVSVTITPKALSYASLLEHGSLDEMNKHAISGVVPFDRH
jgi:hypothetical protein